MTPFSLFLITKSHHFFITNIMAPLYYYQSLHLPHISSQSPFLFGRRKYIYKPHHFESNSSSGLQVLPLHSTPIPLLGIEEAQQCRKLPSQQLFLTQGAMYVSCLFLSCYHTFLPLFYLLYCPSTPSIRDFFFAL